MMPFNEQFPGLSKLWRNVDENSTLNYFEIPEKFFCEGIRENCIDKKVAEEEIHKWITNLRSGDGDYKKVYTNNYMDLLLKLGIGNQAHQDLKDALESTPVQIETFKKDTSNETSEGEIPKQN